MTPPLFQLLYAPMYQTPRLSPAGSRWRGVRSAPLRLSATDGPQARRAPRGGPFSRRLGACSQTPNWSPSRRAPTSTRRRRSTAACSGSSSSTGGRSRRYSTRTRTQLRVTRVDAVAGAAYTVLGWRVDDLDAAVAALRSRGVEPRALRGAWSRTRAVRGPRQAARGSRGSRTRTATPCRSSRRRCGACRLYA